MCFISKNSKIKVAARDIFVIKFFEDNRYATTNSLPQSPVNLVTGYLFYAVPESGILIKEVCTENPHPTDMDWDAPYAKRVVGANAIHSCKYKSNFAVKQAFRYNSIACVCVIPKSTKYCTNGKEYISEKLLVLHKHKFMIKEELDKHLTYQRVAEEMMSFANSVKKEYLQSKKR
jgi:hypothetical protein